MAVPVNEIGEAGVKAAGSFRETVQDLLVPELRAIKVQIDSLTQELRLRTEQLTQEMRLRDEQLRKEMLLRDERQTQAIAALSGKLDFATDIRERLSLLEARLPRQ